MEGVWRVCGGSVEGVWRACGGSVEGVWRECGEGVEGVRREYFFSKKCGGSVEGGVEGVWRLQVSNFIYIIYKIYMYKLPHYAELVTYWPFIFK